MEDIHPTSTIRVGFRRGADYAHRGLDLAGGHVPNAPETLTPFDPAATLRATSPGVFEGDVPDGWQQGRGAFGGLVFGLLVRAMETQVADPARLLRALSGDIAGPVLPGPVRVDAE